jgi:hypothetical protein
MVPAGLAASPEPPLRRSEGQGSGRNGASLKAVPTMASSRRRQGHAQPRKNALRSCGVTAAKSRSERRPRGRAGDS